MKKFRIRINNQIRAREIRVIDDNGQILGTMSLDEALAKTKERNLDLIEISPNAVPPVAKITDYGKFQYDQKKKLSEAKAKAHTTETKSVQVKIGTSEHDLDLKAKKVSVWLKEGHRVKINLFLAGRAKYTDLKFKKERLDRILNLISEEYRVAEEAKKTPKGLAIVVERGKKKKNENK